MAKYVLITGASSGIGYETAKVFAARGENVIVTARRTENLEQLKIEIKSEFPEVDVVVKTCDLSSNAEAIALYESLKDYEIKAVINKAGRGNKGGFIDDSLEHTAVIESQRKRLGTKRGFVAVKSNCSLQSYVPALFPLSKFGIKDVLVCTYQAISGAGKTFATWPEMVDNVIQYIGGEEEKSEKEPLKIWGKVEGDVIVDADSPNFTAQCIRVPVSNGHMGAVFVRFENKPSKEEILNIWKDFAGRAQELELPHAPKQFLNYFEEDNMPQTKLNRDLEGGMAISVGRLREDTQYDYKFVCLSHNTLRGAAGGAVLMAELLCAEGYMD